MFLEILAAAAGAAPQNKFGFKEALEQGGLIAQSTVAIMAIFSFGSFFVLFTRWSDQSKIFKQYKALGNFWKAGSLK